jgi:hypothetical protein
MSVVQPQRKTELIVTEMYNTTNPQKPAVIEVSTNNVQMTSKEGHQDQKGELKEHEDIESEQSESLRKDSTLI